MVGPRLPNAPLPLRPTAQYDRPPPPLQSLPSSCRLPRAAAFPLTRPLDGTVALPRCAPYSMARAQAHIAPCLVAQDRRTSPLTKVPLNPNPNPDLRSEYLASHKGFTQGYHTRRVISMRPILLLQYDYEYYYYPG